MKLGSCTKLALNGGWSYDIIVKWVRESEWNSLVLGLNHSPADIL